jgi:hypothetical protein
MSADYSSRRILTKKLMCRCPICNAGIYNKQLGLDKIETNKVEVFPFPLTYSHQHSTADQKTETHDLTLYLDANFSVRDVLIGKMV